MELIPILATIILMATVSTFFLAVGAYVLYKIRERKGSRVEKIQPQTIKAELITPEVAVEQAPVIVEHQQKAPAPKAFERPNPPSYKPALEPIFVQKKAPSAAEAPVKQEQVKAGPAPAAASAKQNKMLKYTSEGYVSPKEEKKQGAVKWR